MATTRYKITEQILRLAKGRDASMASTLKHDEVVELVNQVINKRLKVESYAILNEKELTGDIVPNGLVIASYENIAVTQYKTNYSKCTLPATPVRLPKGMGVYHIGGENDPFNSYIPVPAGLWQMVSREPLISDLLGQIGYEVIGNKEVLFTSDLTSLTPAVTEVAMRLVVMDISQYTDYEALPVPADMEVDIIRDVLEVLGIKQPADDIVDPISEPTKSNG